MITTCNNSLLTVCDAVLPVPIETRPAMAAVSIAVIPAVSECRAFVPVVGASLQVVDKHCENNQRTEQSAKVL